MKKLFAAAQLARADLGQAMIETALVLPMLVFVVLAGGDLARAFAVQMAIQGGARAGAEAAAMDYSPTIVETEARTRDEMSRTPGMDSNAPVVTVTYAQSNGVLACVSPPTLANPCFATVRVQMTWRTITPWPLIPNTFFFDRSTIMRMINF